MESCICVKSNPVSSIIAGGLIAAGLVVLQCFLPLSNLDKAELISVYAFALAIPILAYKLLIDFVRAQNQEMSLQQKVTLSIETRTPFYEIIFFVGGILAALIGIAAAFFHLSWIACLVFSFCTLISGCIYFSEIHK